MVFAKHQFFFSLMGDGCISQDESDMSSMDDGSYCWQPVAEMHQPKEGVVPVQ
jgi:hypothetical protein